MKSRSSASSSYRDDLQRCRERVRSGVRDAVPEPPRGSHKRQREEHRAVLEGLIDALADEIVARARSEREIDLAQAIGRRLVVAVIKRSVKGSC